MEESQREPEKSPFYGVSRRSWGRRNQRAGEQTKYERKRTSGVQEEGSQESIISQLKAEPWGE